MPSLCVLLIREQETKKSKVLGTTALEVTSWKKGWSPCWPLDGRGEACDQMEESQNQGQEVTGQTVFWVLGPE